MVLSRWNTASISALDGCASIILFYLDFPRFSLKYDKINDTVTDQSEKSDGKQGHQRKQLKYEVGENGTRCQFGNADFLLYLERMIHATNGRWQWIF